MVYYLVNGDDGGGAYEIFQIYGLSGDDDWNGLREPYKERET